MPASTISCSYLLSQISAVWNGQVVSDETASSGAHLFVSAFLNGILFACACMHAEHDVSGSHLSCRCFIVSGYFLANCWSVSRDL